jgi:hypothetical protein
VARPRVFVSLLISVPVVAGLGRLYRPHMDTRLGAALDLALVAILCFTIVKLFQRFEE